MICININRKRYLEQFLLKKLIQKVKFFDIFLSHILTQLFLCTT